MKKILLLIISCFYYIGVFSQSLSPEVVTIAGDYFVGNNATLSWTLGETITETALNDDIILTQGFHQATLHIITSKVFDGEGYNIKIYPIPANQFVNIEIITLIEPVELLIKMYDIMGNKIYNNLVTSSSFRDRIYVNQYPNNLFFLKVTNTVNKQVRTFKIIKIRQ